MNDKKLLLSESIYKKLKAAIIRHEYLPGEPLIETEIAEKLNTSRTPVREALHRLQSEGIVTSHPRSSARVTKVTLNQSLHALEIRSLLESFAAELAASRPNSDTISEAERILDDFDAYLSSIEKRPLNIQDYIALERLGQVFHETVLSASGSKMLEAICNDYLWPSWLAPYHVLTRDYLTRSAGQHRAILQAILLRDPESARQSMWEHFQYSCETLRQAIEVEVPGIRGNDGRRAF